MEYKGNPRWQQFAEKVKAYGDAHKEILDRTSGLTQHILMEDLKEAAQYQKGYYKNANGVYMYVKGVEVTNDTGNLCRMGFNGEDRGVWIHYCLVDDRSVNYIDTPMASFSVNYFNRQWCKPKDLMHPTTKEDFETKVKETITTLCADYTEAVDPKEYYEVIKGWDDLYDEFQDVVKNILPE